MFEANKDYIFSFKKYREDCAKQQIPMGPWAQKVNGARVIKKDDGTKGILHVNVFSDEVMFINGQPARNATEEAYLVEPAWCEEK